MDAAKGVLRMFLALIGLEASMASAGEKVIACAQGTEAQAIFERPPAFELP
ncbi:MAG TPA: hypothetical protein VND93_08605 [Myxococcales bacterium]|jgi:hypothetical protein|nr:hypothetical protein [Myxococcales bacterium]